MKYLQTTKPQMWVWMNECCKHLQTNAGWPEIQDMFSLKKGRGFCSAVLFNLPHITKGLQNHCTKAPVFFPLEGTIGVWLDTNAGFSLFLFNESLHWYELEALVLPQTSRAFGISQNVCWMEVKQGLEYQTVWQQCLQHRIDYQLQRGPISID